MHYYLNREFKLFLTHRNIAFEVFQKSLIDVSLLSLQRYFYSFFSFSSLNLGVYVVHFFIGLRSSL